MDYGWIHLGDCQIDKRFQTPQSNVCYNLEFSITGQHHIKDHAKADAKAQVVQLFTEFTDLLSKPE